MNKNSRLQLQAIKAAKNADWKTAVACNEDLLDHNPQDLGAMNRLGVAYLQLGKKTNAKRTFKQVISIDKSNKIALKHLETIKNKKKSKTPSFSTQHFIEEPGTTKIIELHRLASKSLLDKLSIGQECNLKPKNRYISVETSSGDYIGALPEDLSFRLTKLIKRGNKYSCFVYSASTKACLVYLKEEFKSKRNQNINSFPMTKSALSAAVINDVDERFLLEDNIPVEIVETDKDDQKTIDDIDTSEDD